MRGSTLRSPIDQELAQAADFIPEVDPLIQHAIADGRILGASMTLRRRLRIWFTWWVFDPASQFGG